MQHRAISIMVRVMVTVHAGIPSVPLPHGCLRQSKLCKKLLEGTWRLASIYNEENGVKHFNFGDKPVGMLMFDRSGNVVQFLSKSDVPKFAVANRLKGTDAENRVAICGIWELRGRWRHGHDLVAGSRRNTRETYGRQHVSTNPMGSSGGTSYSHYTRAK